MSGLQMRTSPGDPRLYNPNRDVAHHFPSIGRMLVDRLAERRWPELIRPFLQFHGVTEAQLGEGAAALARFFNYCVDVDVDDMRQALNKAGWFALSAPVQFTLCTVLGQLMLGVYFAGIRDATRLGDGPTADVRALLAAADEAHRILSERATDAHCGQTTNQ